MITVTIRANDGRLIHKDEYRTISQANARIPEHLKFKRFIRSRTWLRKKGICALLLRYQNEAGERMNARAWGSRQQITNLFLNKLSPFDP